MYLLKKGWGGIVVLLICCLNAGVSGVYLAKCWLILEERWPQYRTGLTRTPFATIGQKAYGNWMRYQILLKCDVVIEYVLKKSYFIG